ncbi:MAG: hypothetical protein H6Q58_1513 [Firmicutes bacterium]|nr:hypothetical protein [Bacillota bacterium]
MNRNQKLIFSIFLPVAFLELIMIYAFNNSDNIRYFEFAVTIIMLAMAAAVKKGFREQKILVLSFMFSAVGEFFLLIYPIMKEGATGTMQGLAAFLLAYAFIILALNRSFRWSLSDGLLLLPFICVIGVMFGTLHRYLEGTMLIAVIVFSAAICIMGWTAVATLTRGYFVKRVAVMSALAGVMIFASDFVAAYQIFYPPLHSSPSIPTEIFVRATFVAAWTLLLAIVFDGNILAGGHPKALKK